MPAERLLRPCARTSTSITSYPICELDGMRFIHGHYIAPHIESFGWRMMDRLAWSLTGEEQRPERLSIGDYEALISPLYELMYEMANLPQGKRAQQQFERWLIGMGAVARAPGKASRQAAGFAHAAGRRRNAEEMLEPMDAPTAQILAAMEAVCLNLSVPPGPVVFAHTHIPLTARRRATATTRSGTPGPGCGTGASATARPTASRRGRGPSCGPPAASSSFADCSRTATRTTCARCSGRCPSPAAAACASAGGRCCARRPDRPAGPAFILGRTHWGMV